MGPRLIRARWILNKVQSYAAHLTPFSWLILEFGLNLGGGVGGGKYRWAGLYRINVSLTAKRKLSTPAVINQMQLLAQTKTWLTPLVCSSHPETVGGSRLWLNGFTDEGFIAFFSATEIRKDPPLLATDWVGDKDGILGVKARSGGQSEASRGRSLYLFIFICRDLCWLSLQIKITHEGFFKLPEGPACVTIATSLFFSASQSTWIHVSDHSISMTITWSFNVYTSRF